MVVVQPGELADGEAVLRAGSLERCSRLPLEQLVLSGGNSRGAGERLFQPGIQRGNQARHQLAEAGPRAARIDVVWVVDRGQAVRRSG